MSGPFVLVLRILLASALYLFLCLTLWMIWQDLKRSGFQAMRPRVPALRLEISPPGAGAFFRTFTRSEVLLGRDSVCELRLEDEAISARHAKLSFHQGQWWIEDLHSTNGTILNSIRLTTPTVLTDGDEFQCGGATLRVQMNVDRLISQKNVEEERHD